MTSESSNTIFEFKDYRLFLKSWSKINKTPLKKLAESINLHVSYFSRVMVGQAHFSKEQLYKIGKAVDFNHEELEYFLLLGDADSSGLIDHANFIQNKISNIQRAKLQANYGVTSTFHDNSEVMEYYQMALTSTVHMLLTIERFAENPLLICKKLEIDEEELLKQLSLLEKLRLIKCVNSSPVEILQETIHIKSTNPLSKTNHINRRIEAIKQIQKNKRVNNQKHISVCFSGNDDIANFVSEKFAKFLGELKEEIDGQKPTTVYHLNFDFWC